MGCKAAVQALQKADFLKAKVIRKCDLLTDSQAWTDQQQLQTIYHQVLVLDLEYALDKKVEQELWTVGFKNHISVLQNQARDKKNPHRSESQALLSWCLEAASGFYLTLLQELCTAFDLDLPFRKRLTGFGQTKSWNCSEQFNPPQTSSCIYICQYCLVHLGDIARYRNQRKQAESFYKHAILLSPTSGQPYNQLALLEASQGDKLAAIFYYVRGIAVKNPFPATATNLGHTLSTSIDKDETLTEVQTKLTVNEFIRMFIKVHGLLYTATDLDQAELGVKSINATLTPLVATQSFTEQRLLQLTVINLYALKHATSTGTFQLEELTDDENRVRKLVLDLLAGSLSAFLLPVYTLNNDSTLLDYYALPAIKFILYWLRKEPDVLKENVFQTRLQIWPSLCKLLNSLQIHVKDFDYSKFEKLPLTEDRDLQGFLPLAENFKELNFKGDDYKRNAESEKFIRAKRLIEFGLWLTSFDVNNTKVVVAKENSEDKSITFEPGSIQPDPTTKLLEEMKSFNVTETVKLSKSKGSEKRGGILKPQGSLEKSRKEQEIVGLPDTSSRNTTGNTSSNNINKNDSVKLKRAAQNVALQSIFKKIEENKQVKFDFGTIEKEKPPKVDNKPPTNTKLLPTTTSYFNQPYRTNVAFNQNLKTIANELHQDHFKNSFPNYSNAPYEKPSMQNIPFPKTDVPTAGNDVNKMQQNINFSLPPPPPQHMFGSSPGLQNFNQTSSGFPTNIPHQRPQQIGQQLPVSYQNVNQFPPAHDFNTWKQEDHSTSNWWSNSNATMGPNYQQRDFQINFPYSNNMSYAPPNIDFNKQPPPNQASNVLNPLWSSLQNNLPPNHGPLGYDHPNQGLSLRQAMLKETKNIPPLQNMANPTRDEKIMQVPSSTPGYSLFNSNSWSPSLPGQIRSSESPSEGLIHNLRQQSLFSKQAPLQQLLERQNQLKKGDS